MTDGIACERIESAGPEVALDRQALRERSSSRQNSLELGVSPLRRKVDEIILEAIGIHEPGQGDEWQIVSIDRMRDEQGITGWRFDRPEVGELDDKSVFVEQRRSHHLVAVMEIERRARVARDG